MFTHSPMLSEKSMNRERTPVSRGDHAKKHVNDFGRCAMRRHLVRY